MLYGDATPEILKWNLKTVWPSAGFISNEGGIVLGSHGMGAESVMRNLAVLNQLWDGGDITTDRRTSESFTVRGARLTMAIQVQEPILRAFLDRTGAQARGSGFLARFLLSWPESTQGSRAFREPPDSWPNLEIFSRRITSILNTPVPINGDGSLSPPELSLSKGAKDEWIAFHDKIEIELASGGRLHDVRDVASKIADNAVRLAGLFHEFEGTPGSAVTRTSFVAASRVAEWYLHEARRFFGEIALPVGLANAARLETWIIERCLRNGGNAVPIKTVQQYGPAGLRERAAIDAAMLELEELGRAQRLHEGRRRLIAINPSLLPKAEGPATANTATTATQPDVQTAGSKKTLSSGSNNVTTIPGIGDRQTVLKPDLLNRLPGTDNPEISDHKRTLRTRIRLKATVNWLLLLIRRLTT
jgi:putative DNA primase/helicase